MRDIALLAAGRDFSSLADAVPGGFGLSGPKPCLNLFRIGADGRLAQRRQVLLATFPFCHDFALTDRQAIFFIGSIVCGNMLPVMLGTRSISDPIRFDPAIPMQVLFVDLETLSPVRCFQTGAMIHFGNAWEEGGEIVFDGLFTDNVRVNQTLVDVFDPEARFRGGSCLRYRLELASGAVRSDANDGCVLEVVHDGIAHRSETRVHRAESMERQAILRLRHHLPQQFQGHFTNRVVLN